MKNRVSANVGRAKHFPSIFGMHSEKGAISFSMEMCRSYESLLYSRINGSEALS